jgi:DNA-binding ferritin-like protein
MLNQDFMDALSLVSFMVGIANYNENLSQSDKDDLMTSLDKTTNSMLTRLEKDLEEQNIMLRKILEKLERME